MTDIDPTEPGEASTALVQANPEAHAVVASAMASIGMPSPAEWAALSGMSQQLARSSLVPRGLQGRPDDVMLILQNGRDLQIAPTQALNKVHVIEGKPTIAPAFIKSDHDSSRSCKSAKYFATARIRISFTHSDG